MFPKPVSPIRAPVNTWTPAAPEGRGQSQGSALLTAQLGDAGGLGIEYHNCLGSGQKGKVNKINWAKLAFI